MIEIGKVCPKDRAGWKGDKPGVDELRHWLRAFGSVPDEASETILELMALKHDSKYFPAPAKVREYWASQAGGARTTARERRDDFKGCIACEQGGIVEIVVCERKKGALGTIYVGACECELGAFFKDRTYMGAKDFAAQAASQGLFVLLQPVRGRHTPRGQTETLEHLQYRKQRGDLCYPFGDEQKGGAFAGAPQVDRGAFDPKSEAESRARPKENKDEKLRAAREDARRQRNEALHQNR